MITYRDLAMLSPRATPFNRFGCIFELKYDGFRVLAKGQEEITAVFLVQTVFVTVADRPLHRGLIYIR
jgi:hypothetical protein